MFRLGRQFKKCQIETNTLQKIVYRKKKETKSVTQCVKDVEAVKSILSSAEKRTPKVHNCFISLQQQVITVAYNLLSKAHFCTAIEVDPMDTNGNDSGFAIGNIIQSLKYMLKSFGYSKQTEVGRFKERLREFTETTDLEEEEKESFAELQSDIIEFFIKWLDDVIEK